MVRRNDEGGNMLTNEMRIKIYEDTIKKIKEIINTQFNKNAILVIVK